MTAQQKDAPPETGRGVPGDLFDSAAVATKEERQVTASEKKEPQMRALRRILGDQVMDIFPIGFVNSVEKAYLHWQQHPDSFLVSEFDSQQERDDSLTVMRAYAECAGDKGYTIRTERDTPPKVLHWRVQTRRGTKQDN